VKGTNVTIWVTKKGQNGNETRTKKLQGFEMGPQCNIKEWEKLKFRKWMSNVTLPRKRSIIKWGPFCVGFAHFYVLTMLPLFV
jgi:hypothetical protein